MDWEEPSRASAASFLVKIRATRKQDLCTMQEQRESAALHMIEPRADRPQAITLGAEKAYDAEDFVNELRCQ